MKAEFHVHIMYHHEFDPNVLVSFCTFIAQAGRV